MTDRELLELAAKTAGLNFRFSYDRPVVSKSSVKDEANYEVAAWENWNPLTDEGDRYRLLKALKMGIDFDAQSVIYTLDGYVCEESFREDGDDARAVLRAAAEIGRAMG